MTRDEIRSNLFSNIATVEFTKTDGTLRKMRCTLIESMLPAPVTQEIEVYEAKPARKENPNILSVWDLDNGGWRSFRIDSIKSFTLG